MAKTNQAKPVTQDHNPDVQVPKAPVGPKGYQKAETERFDVAGFWRVDAGAIHGVLVGAYEFLQKTGRNEGKKSRVLVFRLLDPCIATVKFEGRLDEAELSPGELCGAFYSPGLRECLQLAGCKIFALRNKEKTRLKNGNEMWEFDVRFEGKKKSLAIRPVFESSKKNNEDASFDPSQFGDVEFTS